MKLKMTTNLHTHTFRCRHASGTEREYIETALAGGLTTLGFSDHSPYAFPEDHYSGFRMANDLIDDYVSTIVALREEYRGKIDIKIGYELEYYPKFFRDTLKMITAHDVDYVILGQHYLGNEIDELHCGVSTPDESIFVRYIDQVIEAIDTGIYTYVAHPDMLNFTGDEAVFDRHYARLIEHAKDTDTPLEINFLGMRTQRFYPHERFFKLCGEIGAPVCCGCDAHRADDAADPASFTKTVEWIEKYGLNYVASPTLRKVHCI